MRLMLEVFGGISIYDLESALATAVVLISICCGLVLWGSTGVVTLGLAIVNSAFSL